MHQKKAGRVGRVSVPLEAYSKGVFLRRVGSGCCYLLYQMQMVGLCIITFRVGIISYLYEEVFLYVFYMYIELACIPFSRNVVQLKRLHKELPEAVREYGRSLVPER